MSGSLARSVAFVATIALSLPPRPLLAQPNLPTVTETAVSQFSVQQLDAMLAPIALFPDELLTQTLMASTYPLQIVTASRWLEKTEHRSLRGDTLLSALARESWDPSVKSLIPFPQVIAMLNDKLEWTQQLGYAVANQQAAVLDSIQRLRRQAQLAGSLKTTEQQRVVVQEEVVVIEPADPGTVYVPVYQPANVYGEWPYPDYPPVYIPPSPAYYPAAYAPGYVWGTALAFAAGAAVVGGLWGWARPRWGYGNVNINTARYNNINVNRAQLRSSNWRAAAGGVGGRPLRPPGGPVGAPARATRLPANAIGRGNVQVPGSALNRPQIGGGIGAGQARPPQMAQRPSAGQLPAGGQRLAGQGLAGQRAGVAQAPTVLRGSGGGVQRSAGAFAGMGDGGRARQYSARGAQSRGFQQRSMAVGGRSFQSGGGFQARGGGGYRGGGGGRRGR